MFALLQGERTTFMRISTKSLIALAAAATASLASGAPAQAGRVTLGYDTGEHKITVPAGVSTLNVFAAGGTGGKGYHVSSGGRGAWVAGDLPVTPGQVLYLRVGGNGADGNTVRNSGGINMGAGGGGGASDVRSSPGSSGLGSDTRKLVAAGGGGGGLSRRETVDAPSAGGDAQRDGTASENGTRGGHAGVPVGNGAGGCGRNSGFCGSAGLLGFGGNGGQASSTFDSGPAAAGGFNGGGAGGQGGYYNTDPRTGLAQFTSPGGGGGGGRYGGGGGGWSATYSGTPGGGGGGGGSNLVPAGGSSGIDTIANPYPRIAITYTETVAPVVSLNALPALSTNAYPVFSGTAGTQLGDNPRIRVTLYVGASATGAAWTLFDADANPTTGAYSTSYPGGPLPDATWTAVVSQTDRAGNTGKSAPVTFTIDRTAPVVTLTAVTVSLLRVPVFTGFGGTGANDLGTITVRVYAGTNPFGTLVDTRTTTRVPLTGLYTVVGKSLPNGTYTAIAFQSDSLGHVGSSFSRTFVINAIL